jgi:DNA helicase HerA-like ATPase
MTVRLEGDYPDESALRIGAMVKVLGDRDIIGTIAAVQLEPGTSTRHTLVVDLVGEILNTNDCRKFNRGVSQHPVPGAPVFCVGDDDSRAIFSPDSQATIRIGTLYNNQAQPAYLRIDDLLGKHFAVLGASGSGKSCTVALILSAILNEHPNAHVLMLDPHNEYTSGFGDIAEVLNVDNLKLPFWLLDSEESVRVLVRGGTAPERESQAMILRDVITRARRHFAGEGSASASITVDTPVPYRISDLIRFLHEAAGKLDRPDTALPYLRLRTRLESLRDDKRFAFMFAEGFDIPDRLPEVVSRLMRIPVEGKPLAILDLSGVPSEIIDVVVSLCCRIIFDFAVWSQRDRVPPMLLACEEAHRYIPADERGFTATARAITRIAKEGRKYGLSLALISQRPSELSSEALSQCGTVFALRLGNDLDQDFVARTVPDAARGMLSALPSMPTQQAIVSGEGVPIPMRIHFDDLPANRRPRSEGAEFSKAWQTDSSDTQIRDDGVRRWRLQTR